VRWQAGRIKQHREVIVGKGERIGEAPGKLTRWLTGASLQFLDRRQHAASSGGQLGLSQIQGFAPPAQPIAKGQSALYHDEEQVQIG
jgi:hypothetical protein